MKIGIFPGSFNPVHNGHLTIANYVAEFCGYDEVWFLISPKNPMKSANDILDQEIRLSLIEKAIGDYPKLKPCTIEWEMPQPAYTVNTLQKLRVLFPENTFELIIGSDSWDTIHRWKNYQMILNNFKTLVYPRLGTGKVFIDHPNAKMIKHAPKIEISSSVIREAIKEGKDLRFYMPAGVYETLVALDFFKKEEPEKESVAEAAAE
ncbi:MAG: nicotinate-nucleotide adenylyltransferase [Dysgonamonadaceae bacterium]|jgi:nicotinate-nucleotide adenylyltransferase|nr:nicotinate-nucleotide adenylyltransferase [Dysgonamonadaceae bacterium]